MKGKPSARCPPVTPLNRRLELQKLLEDILGSKNVYFEPPPNFQMKYPCIRYKRVRYEPVRADNLAYLMNARYELTFIYRDPDNDVVLKLANLPMCTHDRPYVSNNLHHDTFTIYY